MATVLPFDPHARRRTPSRPLPAVGPREGHREERAIPLRVVRDADEAPRRTPTVRAMASGTSAAPRTAPAAAAERELAVRFFPPVLAVVLLDLATKALALALLPERGIALVGPLSLSLTHNTVSAGAAWLGAATRGANVAATGLVLGLLIMLAPALHRLERRTTGALALMVGGGLGNLFSLLFHAAGVPDFLRIEHASGAWVLNLADLSMLAGLAWLAAVLVEGMRGAAPARPAAPHPRSHRATRAALTVVRCTVLVALGATGLMYAQRHRVVGLTACVPGTPLVLSGANPFSRLDAAQRAATLAHEAVHAAQIRDRGCLAVYRAQLLGSPVERATLEVEAGCAELATLPSRHLPRAAAESTLARTVATAYPSLRAVGFERTLALTRAHCATS